MHQGRITDLIESGKLFADIGQPPLNPAEDRVMLCGSPGMLQGSGPHAGGARFPRGLKRRPRVLCDRKGLRRDLKVGLFPETRESVSACEGRGAFFVLQKEGVSGVAR